MIVQYISLEILIKHKVYFLVNKMALFGKIKTNDQIPSEKKQTPLKNETARQRAKQQFHPKPQAIQTQENQGNSHSGWNQWF